MPASTALLALRFRPDRLLRACPRQAESPPVGFAIGKAQLASTANTVYATAEQLTILLCIECDRDPMKSHEFPMARSAPRVARECASNLVVKPKEPLWGISDAYEFS
jgi:hypothetical protein